MMERTSWTHRSPPRRRAVPLDWQGEPRKTRPLQRTLRSSDVRPDQEIKAGEPIFVDYSSVYWVYQLTGVERAEWEKMSDEELLKAFDRMHVIVDDCSLLLRERLWHSNDQTDSRTVLRKLKQLIPALVKRRARTSVTGHEAIKRQ